MLEQSVTLHVVTFHFFVETLLTSFSPPGQVQVVKDAKRTCPSISFPYSRPASIMLLYTWPGRWWWWERPLECRPFTTNHHRANQFAPKIWQSIEKLHQIFELMKNIFIPKNQAYFSWSLKNNFSFLSFIFYSKNNDFLWKINTGILMVRPMRAHWFYWLTNQSPTFTPANQSAAWWKPSRHVNFTHSQSRACQRRFSCSCPTHNTRLKNSIWLTTLKLLRK